MKKRDEIVFGIHPVQEAILSGKEVDKVLIRIGLKSYGYKELMQLMHEVEIPFQFVPEEKLNQITRLNHQGVIAFISPISYYPLEQVVQAVFEEGKNPLFLVLDRITDVRNFGSIARTAECAGVDAIVIPQKNSVRVNSEALKTSAGALNSLPVCRVPALPQAIQYLKDSGISIIATDSSSQEAFTKADLQKPTAIIMGSEDEGISSTVLNLADQTVSIPIMGSIASLNVAVATGVILYEVVKQRGPH